MDEHGGNISLAMKKYGLTQGKLIDFSASINPLGIPDSIKKAIKKALNYAHVYPDPDYTQLKRSLAKFYNVNSEVILPDNGSVSLIYLIPQALGIKKPLIPLPTFSEYEKATLLHKARPLFIPPKHDFIFDTNDIIKFLKGRDSFYLCNPNNPTGLSMAKEEILKIIQKARDMGIIVILDEVFIEFTDKPDRNSLIAESSKFKNLIILRSLTKYFALAGLRLGLAIAGRDIISRLKKYQPPWPVNNLSAQAAMAFLKEDRYIKYSHTFMQEEREFLFSSLSNLNPLRVWKPSANFIFCKIKDKNINSSKLRVRLARRGILIRDCRNFRGLNNTFFRVAVRTRPENEKLIRELRSLGS